MRKQLQTDFVRNGGIYMLLKAEEGLRSEELSRVQRNMLAAVSVPNLLRLDIREVDFEVSLHYDITGKKMLSHCLKSDKIGMSEFYGLLLQVVAVLDDCKKYMLSPANVLLDEEHIFVEEPLSCGVFYFAYLPLNDALAVVPLSQALLALITRMLVSVSRVEGNGIQQIISFCGSEEHFSLPRLKKMLLELLTAAEQAEGNPAFPEEPLRFKPQQAGPNQGKQAQANAPAAAVAAAASENARKSRTPLRREERLKPDRLNMGRQNAPAELKSSHTVIKEYLPDGLFSGYAPEIPKAASVNPGREQWPGLEEEEAGPKVRITPTSCILGVILLDALCWKFLYLDRPWNIGLYICFAATFLLAGAAYLICSGKLPVLQSASGAKQRENAIDAQPAAIPAYDRNVTFPEDVFGDSPFLQVYRSESEAGTGNGGEAVELAMSGTGQEHFSPAYGGASSWEASSGGAGQPATMLLNKPMLSGESKHAIEPRYYLERFSGDGVSPERITLKPGSFVIGRSEEMAQYVEQTPGVSRAHVEVMVTPGKCCLKDLGSRNGTRFKGELIAPYKEYELETGDVFSLAEVSFKFGKEML
ncbi:DUF6382 domain-containing protein [Paenibacillus macerans]|uniref:DUF6382 domain-containing protein n=1 Tax=Paenibacillus macerans TaxID=44252 RepID=UPI002E1CE8D5|nr:DUF6382 domain-containing protein [Paenibacillus macerans]